MQHVKSLSYFVAVAQNRSIREAAETLHITSSALNRQILDLEEELGAPLFERHARGIRLSAAGEVYLEYARRALKDAESAHSKIDQLQGLHRGHINLAAVSAIADSKLMDLVAEFQEDFPKISFTVTVLGAENVVEAVVERDADLGIAFNPSAQSDFSKIAERAYSIHAIVSKDHPMAGSEEISIFSVQEFPLAIPDRSWGGRRLLDEYLVKTGLKLHPQLVSNSFDVLTKFMDRAKGLCFQIRPASASPRMEGGMMAIPIKELRRYERKMLLGSLKGRVLPVAAALFSEKLVEEFFKLPVEGP